MGAEQDFLNTLDAGEKPAVVQAGVEAIPADKKPPTDEASFLGTLDKLAPEFKEDLSLSAVPPVEFPNIDDPEKYSNSIIASHHMKRVLGIDVQPSALLGAPKYADSMLLKEFKRTVDLTEGHYKHAVHRTQGDDLYHDLLDAREAGKSDKAILAKIEAHGEMPPPEKPVYPWQKAAAFTAGQVPVYADIIKQGLPTGMSMAILGGTAAAATTGGAAAPPAAATFYAAGQTYGSGKAIWKMMEGNAYKEMLDAGVEEKYARNLARYGVGPISAGLNILSFGMFKKMAPVAIRKLMGTVADKTSKGIMKGRAGNLLKSTGTEVVTENLEEINQIIMTEVGINLTNEIRKAKGLEMLHGITRDEFVTRIMDVTEATLYATGTIGSVTTGISYSTDKYMGVDSKKDDRENVIDMTAHMMDKTTDQQREEVKDSGAIILGVEENEEGEVTGMLMADRKSGEIFETGPNPTAEEIYTQTGKIPQVEIDVDKVIETGQIEAISDLDQKAMKMVEEDPTFAFKAAVRKAGIALGSLSVDYDVATRKQIMAKMPGAISKIGKIQYDELADMAREFGLNYESADAAIMALSETSTKKVALEKARKEVEGEDAYWTRKGQELVERQATEAEHEQAQVAENNDQIEDISGNIEQALETGKPLPIQESAEHDDVGFESQSVIAARELNAIQERMIETGERVDFSSEEFVDLIQAVTIDRVSGFKNAIQGSAKYDTIKRAQQFVAENPEYNAHYIEIDLKNLGGKNNAMGHQKANAVYRKIADLIKARTNDIDGFVDHLRHGGDELALVIISKADLVEIERIIIEAQIDVEEFALNTTVEGTDVSLMAIAHPKHPGDLTKRGIGFTIGIEGIEPDLDIDKDIVSSADTELEGRKKGFDHEYSEKVKEARLKRLGREDFSDLPETSLGLEEKDPGREGEEKSRAPITARSLVESQNREEIDTQLDTIFGTHEELDALEAATDESELLDIADEFRADLEYAANERNEEDVQALLVALREKIPSDRKNTFSVLGYPKDEGSRPASEIILDINQAIGETGAIGKGFSPQEVNQLFTELAQNSWEQGIRTFKDFSSSVKESVGKAWDNIKDTVKQVWDSVVEFNKKLGEVGAVGRDISKEKLQIRPKTVQAIKSLAEQVRAAKAAGDSKLAASLRTQLVDLIGRAKSEAATAQISTLTEKERVRRRRQTISTIRDYFGLTDNDLQKISRKDVRLMSKYEFKKFKDDIQTRALEFSETRQAKLELLNTIHELNLQKVDNFRKAMDLPPIRDMSLNQLRDFDELISEFHEGDSFLNKRQLETVDRTFLEGIRTWREAKEKLAAEAGVSIEDLDTIKVTGADNFKWDNSLYESNPFYRVLVTRVTTSLLDAELKAHGIETDVFDLAKKAQKSVKRSLADRAIPNDKQIFDYLEANKDGKAALAGQMTSEQIDLAHYMQEYFSQALTYLLETKSLNRGRENYFVHMRRTLLESIREDGLITGVKEMFKNYEQDQMAFNILDDNTGNILPLEKFFQFSLQRSGALTPTKNIVRAFLTYVNTFEKKVALDGIIPAMSIYAQSLTPTVYTQKGLEIDQSIKKFVNQYINNKKGRRISYDSIVRQGGKLDLIMNSTRMLISMLKLGFSPITQTAAPIGEQSGNLIMMGVSNQAKGTARMVTKKGKAIIEKYEAVVGRSLFETLTAPGEEITGRITSAMFAGFHAGSRVANAQYLLGMVTDAEYDSGTIGTKRLAELELEKGRFRAVPGTASLVGSTSLGKLVTHFKSWAIPVIRTTLKDLAKVAKDLKNKPYGEKLSSREAAELLRISALTATVLAMYGIYQADDDDDSLLNKMVNRVLSEASLIYSAFDVRWMLFTTPPAIKWTQDLGMILADMVQLVEFKDGSGLKGPRRLVRHFTPGFVKSFQKKKKKPKY